jgi:hypothetical protein
MKLPLFAMLFAGSIFSFQSGSGVLSGQILTSNGDPVVGVRVMALDANSLTASPVFSGITETDSSGHYRLNNVLPGRYYIQAGLINSPIYYPGVGDVVNAKAIAVTNASVNERLDFVLEKNSLGFKVLGHVARRDSGNAKVVDVILVTGELDSNPQMAEVNSDGSFEFSRVAPGKYLAELRILDGTTLSEEVVVVDKDVSGVELSVPKILEIAGKVILEGGGDVPAFFFRMERPAFGRMTYSARPDRDGSFKANLPEGMHITIQGFNPNKYTLKSVTYGSVDLLKDPLKAGGSEMIITFAPNQVR